MMITPATSHDDLVQIKGLFREYAEFLNVDLCFQNFETELAELPGKYALPTGALYLAKDEHSHECLGCVALRPIGETADLTCEMKRLYVKPKARGQQLGRQLALTIIQEAQSLGYQYMQLDTLASLKAATKLYESLGFVHIAPYYDNPLEDVVYMKLDLRVTS